jgi:DNA-binding transcriptional LysR family regulator
MDEQRLRIFVTVVEERSFTAAARRLYMTQSGVSRAIEALERELGVKLLHRERSGMRTTDVGDRLLMRSRVILAELQRARQEAADISSLRAGKLHIGGYPSVCAHFLPGVLRQFMRAYPNLDIDLVESSTAEVENWVRQGAVDVGFAVLPIPDLHTVQIAVDKRVCALPEDHAEASSAEPLDVHRLAKEPFILPRGYHEEKIKEIFQRTGIDPPVRFRLRDIRTVLAMVRNGLGWSIVNEWATPQELSGICLRPVIPEANIDVGLVLKSQTSTTPAVKAFVQTVEVSTAARG